VLLFSIEVCDNKSASQQLLRDSKMAKH